MNCVCKAMLSFLMKRSENKRRLDVFRPLPANVLLPGFCAGKNLFHFRSDVSCTFPAGMHVHPAGMGDRSGPSTESSGLLQISRDLLTVRIQCERLLENNRGLTVSAQLIERHPVINQDDGILRMKPCSLAEGGGGTNAPEEVPAPGFRIACWSPVESFSFAADPAPAVEPDIYFYSISCLDQGRPAWPGDHFPA